MDYFFTILKTLNAVARNKRERERKNKKKKKKKNQGNEDD